MKKSNTEIPKIIHQLWIGPKPAPTKFMKTWKDKHPNYEYIFWNEEELLRRGFKTELKNKIDDMEAYNGKADILRWEILYHYGGVFLDADSICIESLDDLIDYGKCFAGYENEQVRGAGWTHGSSEYDDILGNTHALIATGTMAFTKNHDLPRLAIEWIKENDINEIRTGRKAWRTVGPGLLTRLYYSRTWNDMIIYPSYYFLPIHASGIEYHGHSKIYAYQEWGSTKQTYELMNYMDLPPQFIKPKKELSVSVLISSFNTKAKYLKECMESIRQQNGHFNIEIIWINDGSDEIHTKLLKAVIEKYRRIMRFTDIVYCENDGNKGIGYTLNKGILMCSHEIIIKMDSDDIMMPNRIQKQFKFMLENPQIHICGGQVQMFDDAKNNRGQSNHPSITWDDYKMNPSHWFVNHPTVCYRRKSVLDAGNYDQSLKQMCEDFELELRMLKTHGYIHNFPECLILYRLHDKQVTHKGGEGGMHKWNNIRQKIIHDLVN